MAISTISTNEAAYSDAPEVSKIDTPIPPATAEVILKSDDETVGYLESTQVIERREQTGGILALVFILGFFIMLISGFSLAAFSQGTLSEKSQQLQDILLTISGILSGPLGFVVGYYFRRSEEEENV